MDLSELLGKKILIFDGSAGSYIQSLGVKPSDYRGSEGLGDVLCLYKPDIVEKMHEAYLQAGADIIETNTFNANSLSLSEYGLQDKVSEINRAAVAIAKRAAQKYSTKDKPRFVFGDCGAATKLPSLGQIDFDSMVKIYYDQAHALIENGIDLIGAETCQDLLQIKAFVVAAKAALKDLKKNIPVSASLTFEKNGTTLLGTDISSALTSLVALDLSFISINCSTGPAEMEENVRYLAQNSPIPIAVLPNAGLPENIDGKAIYRLSPEEFAKWQRRFAEEIGVELLGGCCGTNPKHIHALYEAVKDIKPKKRKIIFTPAVSSLYQSVNLGQEPKPFIIGERTNASGSKKFRELLEKDDLDGMISVAKDQELGGAHAIDVSVAQPGRDEEKDMHDFVGLLSTRTRLPIMIDSTNPVVVETALKLIGSKPIINSVNLEDGEKKLRNILELTKKYGAAVVALTIDEKGMADTAKRKLEIAQRIYKIATEEFGIDPSNILFDALTFSLGSGDSSLKNSAKETIEGIKLIKKHLPHSFVSLGVSNVSYGLKPGARRILNSVFLNEAVKAGLDAAIINAKQIAPLHMFKEDEIRLAGDLIYNKKDDALTKFINHFEAEGGISHQIQVREEKLTIEEQLKNCVINGSKNNLEEFLTSARKKYEPAKIISDILLDGMKTVGEYFGAGKTQLPFVLQSAEVMKAAVDILKPFMGATSAANKGSIVLATVRGDVHDIGKNLVDIILSNNGYTVYNIGVKQNLENIVEALNKYKPDALGLSGLLVKSTQIMKEDLEELAKRGYTTPVVCGGAALNEKFVNNELSKAYKQKVYYGKDAYSALSVIEEILQCQP